MFWVSVIIIVCIGAYAVRNIETSAIAKMTGTRWMWGVIFALVMLALVWLFMGSPSHVLR